MDSLSRQFTVWRDHTQTGHPGACAAVWRLQDRPGRGGGRGGGGLSAYSSWLTIALPLTKKQIVVSCYKAVGQNMLRTPGWRPSWLPAVRAGGAGGAGGRAGVARPVLFLPVQSEPGSRGDAWQLSSYRAATAASERSPGPPAHQMTVSVSGDYWAAC